MGRNSRDYLVQNDAHSTELQKMVSPITNSSVDSSEQREEADRRGHAPAEVTEQSPQPATNVPVVYRTYKRRWFGLVELVLLNIVVSWGWLTYAPVANTSAAFFDTTPAAVNWLVVGFFFAFVFMSPVAYYVLNKRGPKTSIVASATFMIVGSWIRYGGCRASPPSYTAVMIGQIIIGFSQPFILAAPTRFSELWFSPRGRISATAITTLANPFGGAVGSLVNPFITINPPDVGPMTLYIAIITSVVSVPAFFIPSEPPTPVAPSSTIARPPIRTQLRLLGSSINFWLTFIPYIVYVGFFNSFSTLLTQILTPYGFSQNDAGIAGAVLILVGLVAAAISSPIIDRWKPYLLFIRILVPILGIGYLIFIWAPPSRGDAYPYVVCALLGAASFSLVPVALEWMCEITYPVGPELSSVLCWSGGQFAGAIFIIISEALEAGSDGDPPFNMQRALIFEAVLALVVVPCAFLLGVFAKVDHRRLEADKISRQTTHDSG